MPGAVIISAGFKEIGEAGAKLEQEILADARRGGMRIVGPNCLGVMIPRIGLNATFATTMAKPGNVAFLSQSGALCTAILDWSLKENVGFSAFASLGSMLDVGWSDLIYYLGDDPNTKSIIIYMETIGDARGFLSAAREVALTKPIIVIKPGRTEQAAKAAASHTGSLTGSDEVLQAAFQRVGVLRVDTISESVRHGGSAGQTAPPQRPAPDHRYQRRRPRRAGHRRPDHQRRPTGRACRPKRWRPSTKFFRQPGATIIPSTSLVTPAPELYANAVEFAAKDPNTDGLLVILTPQAMTDATATAEQLKPRAKAAKANPSWPVGWAASEVEAGEDILNAANIPTFKYPDRAARAFYYMWRYSDNLRSLYETPAARGRFQRRAIDRAKADELLASSAQVGPHDPDRVRVQATSRRLRHSRPSKPTSPAPKPKPSNWRTHLGFPVVLKLYSETITHKTDVGGVQFNLRTAAAVRRAWRAIETAVTKKAGAEHFLGVTVQPMIKLDGYELIVGSSIDPQFGPVLLFGTGGQLVEVFKDRALGLPPLNATLARRMMERTRIFTALKGVRGRQPVDLAALEQLLVRFSQLVIEQPWIAEIDINPLLVSPERILALDARVVLHDPATPEKQTAQARHPPLSGPIRHHWQSADKTPVIIRPIRPEDEPLMVKFHETLSEESVYHRYFSALKLSQRVAHERLDPHLFQ